MIHPLAVSLVVASVPITLALCRSIGPGRAAPYTILGTFLFLSRTNPDDKFFGVLTIDKLTVAGLSLLLGILLFDRKTLARARSSWVDVPMLLYIAAPVVSLLLGKTADVAGALDQSWLTFAEWGVPYAVGRLYFADRDGPRRLAVAVAIAGLVYVPFCVFEMVMGKGWFLRSMILGLSTDGEYRLGGWRPIVLMSNGLELVSWMALAAVSATWLWACPERWRAKYLPSWLPPAALIATTIACRGIYGYAVLAIGLATIGLLLLTRSKYVLLPLLILPVAYIGLRVSGAWDGRDLVRLAEYFGPREASSVALRLDMEDWFIRETTGHGIVFGLGGRYAESWADGWWLTLLKRGGLLAVGCHYAAFLLPPMLFLGRRSPRSGVTSAATGLALFVILHMLDSLHNTPLIAVSTLLGGSLAGTFLAGFDRGGRGHESRSRATSANPGHATYRLSDIGTEGPPSKNVDVPSMVRFLMATGCLLYVFDHARVEGQEGAKLVGSFGSDFFFASAGVLAAGFPRRSLARVATFALMFGLLTISFNLANHPASRPVWMANILQGMAFSALVVACWRRATGGGPLAFAVLAVVSSAWWACRKAAPVFPGSQYLYAAGDIYYALYPMVPWLTLAALGAILFGSSSTTRAALAIGLGLAGLACWDLGPPFGPPIKFPVNPTHLLLGGSFVSAIFCLAEPARRWMALARALNWLGSRWFLFFYVFLGLVKVFELSGVTQPIVCWTVLTIASIAATWLISEIFGRIRRPFRRLGTWVAIIALTFAIGLLPGIPNLVVYGMAGVLGLALAARYDEVATLILGPKLDELRSIRSPASGSEISRDLARIAMVVAILVAPELLANLPAPFGTAPRSVVKPPEVIDEFNRPRTEDRPAIPSIPGPKPTP